MQGVIFFHQGKIDGLKLRIKIGIKNKSKPICFPGNKFSTRLKGLKS